MAGGYVEPGMRSVYLDEPRRQVGSTGGTGSGSFTCLFFTLVGWVASFAALMLLVCSQGILTSPIYGVRLLPEKVPVSMGLIRHVALTSCIPRAVLEVTSRVVYNPAMDSSRSEAYTVNSVATAAKCEHGAIFGFNEEVALMVFGAQAFKTTPKNAQRIMKSLEGGNQNGIIDGMSDTTRVFFPRMIIDGRVVYQTVDENLSNGGSGRRLQPHIDRAECEIEAPMCYPMYYSCMEEWQAYYDHINGCKAAFSKDAMLMY